MNKNITRLAVRLGGKESGKDDLYIIPDPDPGSRGGLSFDLLRTDIKDSVFARS